MTSTTEFIHPINAPWLRIPGPSPRIASAEPDHTSLISCAPNGKEPSPLVRNADIDAFDELIQRHRGACVKRATLIVHNLSDAEDAVQSAFRKAFQYREQFQGNGCFAAWLGRIVENECLMRIRKERNA